MNDVVVHSADRKTWEQSEWSHRIYCNVQQIWCKESCGQSTFREEESGSCLLQRRARKNSCGDQALSSTFSFSWSRWTIWICRQWKLLWNTKAFGPVWSFNGFKGKGPVSFFSSTICNESIKVMGEKVQGNKVFFYNSRLNSKYLTYRQTFLHFAICAWGWPRWTISSVFRHEGAYFERNAQLRIGFFFKKMASILKIVGDNCMTMRV